MSFHLVALVFMIRDGIHQGGQEVHDVTRKPPIRSYVGSRIFWFPKKKKKNKVNVMCVEILIEMSSTISRVIVLVARLQSLF